MRRNLFALRKFFGWMSQHAAGLLLVLLTLGFNLLSHQSFLDGRQDKSSVGEAVAMHVGLTVLLLIAGGLTMMVCNELENEARKDAESFGRY